jgi:hypothetical protein
MLSESQFATSQLLDKFEHVFSKNTLDLGRTYFVNHTIELDDTAPFKLVYRSILLVCMMRTDNISGNGYKQVALENLKAVIPQR